MIRFAKVNRMIKKFVTVLLTVFYCFSCVIAQESATGTQDSLQSLANDFWQWRTHYQPFSKDDIPRIDHPLGPRDWSAASIAKQKSALQVFETRWKNLTTEGWSRSQQVDYRLTGSAIARVRWELDLNRRWERDPSFYLDQTLTALLESLLVPPPFDARRSQEISERMKQIPGILSEGKTNLHPIRPFAQLAIADLNQIRPKLMRVQQEVGPMLQGTAGDAAAFRQSAEKASAALESYQSWLQQNLDTMPTDAAVGRVNYEILSESGCASSLHARATL